MLTNFKAKAKDLVLIIFYFIINPKFYINSYNKYQLPLLHYQL